MRRLSAIEIAEGALLADIAIVLELIATYLPVGGAFFRLLIPTVFTLLVLRRGLYAGLIALFVAIFVTGVMLGVSLAVGMVFECGAGIFLGVTMRYRMPDFWLLLLGVTGAAIGLFVSSVLVSLLLGVPASTYIIGLHRTYDTGMNILHLIAYRVGLGLWWQQHIVPAIVAIMNVAFTYWLALYLLLIWLVMWPVVIVVYYVTNLFVRLLGYPVRPFPGGRINKMLRWGTQTSLRLLGKSRLTRQPAIRAVVKEIRRMNMQRKEVEL